MFSIRNKRSRIVHCTCMKGLSILKLFVLRFCVYILEMFRSCGMLCFSFYLIRYKHHIYCFILFSIVNSQLLNVCLVSEWLLFNANLAIFHDENNTGHGAKANKTQHRNLKRRATRHPSKAGLEHRCS
jgi:hypothetical protein